MNDPTETCDDDGGDLHELDRLLNDPDVPMQAARVWDLLDKVAGRVSMASR